MSEWKAKYSYCEALGGIQPGQHPPFSKNCASSAGRSHSHIGIMWLPAWNLMFQVGSMKYIPFSGDLGVRILMVASSEEW